MNSALLQSGWEDFETKKQMNFWDTQEKKEVKSRLSTRLPKLDLERLSPAPVSFSLFQIETDQWYLVGMSGFQKVASG